MHDQWPFVGREQEMQTAFGALSSCRGVVLIGQPGVGKTRLAAEVADRLERSGHAVARCYATVANSAIPFGALARVLPPDMQTGNPLGTAVAHLRERGNVAIAVDDVHLLDDASVALLHHLIRHDLAKVVLTVRPGHRPELWKDDVLVRLPVNELSRAETAELLVQTLAGHVDSRTTRLMWSRSAGNPLYLKELVTSGLAIGALAQLDGIWSWQGRIDMDGRLAEVVRANLGRLDEHHRTALEVLAYGEPLELDLLADLASPEAVDELEVRGLLRIEASGHRMSVRLGHPLYGSLLRTTCPTLRARAHQRALADRLEATGARRREDLMRIATWRLDSNSPASADLLATAAEQAWVARDVPLAERLCRAAIDEGGAARAGSVLGQVLMYGRAPDQAEKTMAEIMAGTSDPLDLARLGTIRAANLFYGLARAAESTALLRTLDHPDLPLDASLLLRAQQDTQDALHEPVGTVLARADTMLAMDGLPEHVAVHALALHTRALCLLHAGRYAESLDTIAAYEPQAVAMRQTHPSLHNGAVRTRCFCLLFSGALDEAEALASKVYDELVSESRWTFTETALYCVLAYCARMRGQAVSAQRLATEGSRAGLEWPLIFDAMVIAEVAANAALQGHTEQATEALSRAAAARQPAWLMTGTAVDIARAWVLAGTGQVAEAAEVALLAAASCSALGAHSGEVMALHDAARFGADTSARLGELARQLGDPMTRAYALHASGRALGSAVGLEQAAASFAALGATLFAAEALGEAARLHRAAGRADAAGHAAARQALLVRKFDDITTPALRSVLGGLTRRQLEVAQLAASGLTNQEIAEQLHTSKRTVENHLHAAYSTLGVSGRHELGSVLGPA